MPSSRTCTSGPPWICKGRSRRMLMGRGNTSPAATSRHGTATEPFPPGVTSCADTTMVSPRTRCELPFLSLRAMCRSSTIAPPRADARDSPTSEETSVTGESGGKLMAIELCGSSGVSWATHTPRRSAGNITRFEYIRLLHVHVDHRHVARVGVHVAGPHGPAGVGRVVDIPEGAIPQAQPAPALGQLDAVAARGHHHSAVFGRDRRDARLRQAGRGTLQPYAGYHEQDHSGISQQRVQAGERRFLDPF